MSSSIPTPHLPLEVLVEPVQVGAELPHHLGRKVTASLTAFRSGRQVAPDQREVVGQAVHRLARPGQPEESAALEDAAGGDDDLAALVRADLAQVLLAAGAGEEELDVLPAQAGRVVPPVGARPQALGEQVQVEDLRSQVVSGPFAPALRCGVPDPALGGLPQPRL
jgi:hypothetical protein